MRWISIFVLTVSCGLTACSNSSPYNGLIVESSDQSLKVNTNTIQSLPVSIKLGNNETVFLENNIDGQWKIEVEL